MYTCTHEIYVYTLVIKEEKKGKTQTHYTTPRQYKHIHISINRTPECPALRTVHVRHTIRVLVNPRRACAARVTVVGLSVCLFVCPLVNISLLERLFVLKTLSHTQRATKVKKYVGFSLKMLRCKARAVPALYG